MLSGNTVSQLIPFALAPLLARLFTPVEFAVLANFMAIVGMLGIVATGRLELAIVLPKEKREAQDIVFTGFAFTLLVAGVSLLFPLFADRVGEWYQDTSLSRYLWLVPVSVLSVGLLGLASNWSLRHQFFRSISSGKIAQSLVNNGLAACLGYWGWGIPGLIGAWLLSQFINILLLLIPIQRKVGRSDFSLSTFRTTLTAYRDFPTINSLHAFTDIFVTQFLLYWIISTRFGQTELGLFAVMHKYVRAPIILITSSVSQLYYVEAGKAIQEKSSPKPIWFRTVRTSLYFAIPFTIVLLLAGPHLFQWYLGTTWTLAGDYARCLSPMLLMMFLVSPVSGTPILFQKQKHAYLFSIAGYLLSLTGLWIAIHYGFSFQTALWCYSGGYCIYQIGLLAWYLRLVNTQISTDEGSH